MKNIDQLSRQVKDDVYLLEQMMQDLGQSDELYKPTNYWKVYEKIFLPEIKKKGLYNFRRRRHTVLESFGATDTLCRGSITPKIEFKGVRRIADFMEKILWGNPIFPLEELTHASPAWLASYFYYYVHKKFKSIGWELNKCPTTLFGNPEDVIEINNAVWSLAHLQYCSMLADAAPHIKLSPDAVICELGTGMGRNIEILAKLFADLTLLLFDIPPQLYIANQYLLRVFADRLIPYRESLLLEPQNSEAFRNSIKGKIVILPSWAMPKWSAFKVDLFWNSASFQEMEPVIVKNYLEIVKKMRPQFIYIDALPQGNYWGEWKPGRGGTKEPVLSQYYVDFLKEEYKLETEYYTDYFLRIKEYKSYIFKKSK